MDNIYLIFVIVLLILAVSDLIVGVSNDAVNFLNSAIGAKAASFKVIMMVAAVGIIFGATFSSGMMEVARKGIFNPSYFYFSEIILIFLAVMITDVILLDGFNTFGMPTSTTVSIVFELLGAAVGVALIKIGTTDQVIKLESGIEKVAELSDYINSDKALLIISGILLSVVIAFTAGTLIQYLSRLLFTFKYEKNLKYFGALWGGLAITSITYFILIKGLKGSAYASYTMPDGLELKEWVQFHSFSILLYCFMAWVIILQLLNFIKKFDILKFVVLVGTFALAMAFAGNDLVNFIGVPLAGYHAFKDFISMGVPAEEALMTSLSGKVETPFVFLLMAGAIMVVTLWTSKKAKSVVKTSLDLGRQEEGYERFSSSLVSRIIVRSNTNVANFFKSKISKSFLDKIDKRFDQNPFKEKQIALGADAPAFDMIRASVTLVVASILISFATSLKLPLSTTYVTFMVAMGTSLADRAWGSESAVYRVTGVISVIGGWFFTALSAFLSAFVLAILFSYFGFPAVFILVAIAGFTIYRTHFLHKKRVQNTEIDSGELGDEILTNQKIIDKSSKNVIRTLSRISTSLNQAVLYFEKQDLKRLKSTFTEFEKVNINTKALKDNVSKTITKLEESEIESGHYYVQVVGYLREIAHSANFIIQPAMKHLANSHKALLSEQFEELSEIQSRVKDLIMEVNLIMKSHNYSKLDKVIEEQTETLKLIKTIRKNQVKRIKEDAIGTRNSMLIFNILEEYKNIILYIVNLLKSQRDFTNYINGEEEGQLDELQN
ncbi:MAG: inorganic phosphate transporter [Bacteroidales bacterium]|nr:inorganic phosphate transporter [Bacteroidales bacterium]MCF8403021.1 inorganic phosphate transporter [Bacteroidales bacterium]